MVAKVLFVCLGNICRSPIAEAVFLDLIEKNGDSSNWEVDSAAIGNWHVGKLPDSRARKTLKQYNIEYNNHARQVKEEDFSNYDYIFGMDNENISDLKKLSRQSSNKAKILLLGEFDPEGEKIIRDPYYDHGSEGFEKCYHQCVRCCTGFLSSLKK